MDCAQEEELIFDSDNPEEQAQEFSSQDQSVISSADEDLNFAPALNPEGGKTFATCKGQ